MKRINPHHQTEKEGLLKVQTILNEIGWIYRPTPNDDYGIDGEIEIVASGSPTHRLLKAQIKSGASYISSRETEQFAFSASHDDLNYWLACPLPVILFVCDPKAHEVYWKWIQGYFRDNTAEATTKQILFSRTGDRFSSLSMELLTGIAGDSTAPADADIAPPSPHFEVLWSNLLKVIEFPRHIYSVSTGCTSPQEVRTLLGDRPKSPVVLKEQRLHTFSNLSTPEHPLLVAASKKDIAQMPTADWEVDETKRRWLVELMNATLRKKCVRLGMVYDRNHDRYYFPSRNKNIVTVKYHALTRWISRKVAYPYPETNPKFWVHHGVRLKFKFYGNDKFLCVEPQFTFTLDGERLLSGERVGRLSTKRKAREYNQQVINHLVFWRELLAEKEPLIRVYPAMGDQAFSVAKRFADGMATFGISGDERKFYDLESVTDFELLLEEDEHENQVIPDAEEEGD